MSSRSQHYGFQSATMVQPANGGHAYLFGTNSSENDLSEEDGESFELRPRGKERMRNSNSKERLDDIIYLSRTIQEGDTLNSIALQYHCSVADIKRANSLLTEQDFFALRLIKIPVRRFSVLTETHVAGPSVSASSTAARQLAQTSAALPLPTESSTDSCSSADSVEGFLLEKDKDIEQLVKSTRPSRSSLSEVVSSLTLQQPLLGEVERKPVQRKDPYYGADWGMRWWTAVAIMLFVGVVTPVFYLLYYEVVAKPKDGAAVHPGVPSPSYSEGQHEQPKSKTVNVPGEDDQTVEGPKPEDKANLQRDRGKNPAAADDPPRKKT